MCGLVTMLLEWPLNPEKVFYRSHIFKIVFYLPSAVLAGNAAFASQFYKNYHFLVNLAEHSSPSFHSVTLSDRGCGGNLFDSVPGIYCCNTKWRNSEYESDWELKSIDSSYQFWRPIITENVNTARKNTKELSRGLHPVNQERSES
jgi:hypothetical protein